jgi:broad specificity phosphatase PhoE
MHPATHSLYHVTLLRHAQSEGNAQGVLQGQRDFPYVILGIIPQANFYGPRFRFHNAAFASLTYDPSRHVWSLESLNDRTHWPRPD